VKSKENKTKDKSKKIKEKELTQRKTGGPQRNTEKSKIKFLIYHRRYPPLGGRGAKLPGKRSEV
jgi:hypothetical protein